jgi:DNA repair exonuclease SbcCD ATPase subunit
MMSNKPQETSTRDRIMALLSPPSQDVHLTVKDARWIKDEIERLHKLREATENWRLQTAEACERAREERDHYRDKYHSLKAEIERLRAVLEGLLQDTQHRNHDCGDEDCPVKIAREALRDD